MSTSRSLSILLRGLTRISCQKESANIVSSLRSKDQEVTEEITYVNEKR